MSPEHGERDRKDRRLHWCVIGMQKKQSFWTVRLGLFYFTVGADKSVARLASEAGPLAWSPELWGVSPPGGLRENHPPHCPAPAPGPDLPLCL